ncbi:MAG: RloB domain-containing protein [Deltaproteobacteria bacterium]|nr:RloB domain-containing protein [Deltaproteobacteria bacterium]
MPIDRRRLLEPEQHRDAALFFVATEGAKDEPAYFRGLKDRRVISRSRVRVVVIPSEDGKSAPKHVLDNLEREVYACTRAPQDQHWLVFDRDRWPDAQLHEAVERARGRHYDVAVSNPGFELWLLLHFRDVEADAPLRADQCRRDTHEALSGIGREQVEAAISRSSALDTDPRAPWPANPGTRVYRLVEQLLGTTS